MVKGTLPSFKFPTRQLNVTDLSPTEVATGALSEINIKTECDGTLSDFGSRFWTYLRSEAGALSKALEADRIVALNYRDRYLRSPLHAALLSQILKALSDSFSDDPSISVATIDMPKPEFAPSRWNDNWPTNEARAEVLRGALEDAVGRRVDLEVRRKGAIDHRRSLRIDWESGYSTTLWIDEGMGAWRVAKYQTFDFSASALAQTRALRRVSTSVYVPQPKIGTWILVRHERSKKIAR